MGGKCVNEIMDSALRKLFYKLGVLIGKHPGYFIVVPILLTLLCATGVQRMVYNYDPEYLFSPTNGQGKGERDRVEQYFPTNYSDFKASRITRPGKLARLIIIAKDNGSMLRTHIWDQLLYLDEIVYNVTVEHEELNLSYENLCARWNYNCYENEILRLSDAIPSIEIGEINITYPITIDPYTFEAYTLPVFFGGEKVSEIGTVTYVKAVSLSYFLDVSEDWKNLVGDDWEKQFLEDVNKFADLYYPDLEIGMFVSNTPAWEMENSKLTVTTTLIINTMVLVVFSFLAPIMADSAKSKPLIGFCGLFTATLATVAGFGFCCYIGVEFISLNFAAPFLLFGIGIDDTFVVLSSWHRSSPHLSVPERMGRCFSDAAVSITVTSLTDFFSFIAGVLTPFPCVRIFCLYTGISVAFIYIWHITLFAGFLALAGRAEKNNRHGLLVCCEVTPRSLAEDRSWLYRTFMTGGINSNDPHNPKDNKDHVAMVFFRDTFGGALTKRWVKCLVLLAYVTYMAAACWGFTNIKEGLDKKNTANYDSYSVKYYEMDDTYFKKYAFTISVVFSGPNLDFSNIETQKKIEYITKKLENSTYIDADATESWLREFLDYVDRNKGYADVDLPISTEQDFANTLMNKYLSDSTTPARLDVAFDAKHFRIEAARFLIQGYNINNSVLEQNMVEDLREICARFSTEDLQVTVFQPFFIFIDQFIAILPQAIQTILITAVVMVIISLFLIPSVKCALWVSFSIVSIEIGVIGFMTLWGINLDGVALINLIMCIGFSVDFSAHICYHYMTAEAEENDGSSDLQPSTRIRASLHALGLPIVQGASSTILGVFGLAFAPCYLFVTFFKMIFLVILLGALHGLILLPVLLSIFGPGQCCGISTSKERGKSRKLQSYESSAISTPTITTFSKRQFTNDCHINSAYNGVMINSSNLAQISNRQTHTRYDTDEHDGIESICSCTINLGYVNDKDDCVDNISPITYQVRQDTVEGTKRRKKYLHSIDYRYHKNIANPNKHITTETTSTEQSSPSTLSISSNTGRKIPRVQRHLPPHARIAANHCKGNRVGRHRHQRPVTSKPPALNITPTLQQGGLVLLNNGVVLSPSQLMLLKGDHANAYLSKRQNVDHANNQLAVVVLENQPSAMTARSSCMMEENTTNSCNIGNKYSDATSPLSSTSSSSASSPSNIRSPPVLRSNGHHESWDDKLNRTSKILPGRVTKHVSSMKNGASPPSNGSPRANSSHRNNVNSNLFGHHRHRKVTKTRSHMHRPLPKNTWDGDTKYFNHMLHTQGNGSNIPPIALNRELGINQTAQNMQDTGKKCLHKTKSDFGMINNECIKSGQVMPIENMFMLNNTLTDNSSPPNNNNVPKLSAKPPLKKANTFPYETLHNDTTSYSSDNESMCCEDNQIDDRNNTDEHCNGNKSAFGITSVFVDETSTTHVRKR